MAKLVWKKKINPYKNKTPKEVKKAWKQWQESPKKVNYRARKGK